MSIIKETLSKLENHLQSLVEGSAAWLYPSTTRSQDLAHRLTQAMEAKIIIRPDGQVIAPNLFTLIINPASGADIRESRYLFNDLARAIEEYGLKSGFVFVKSPEIHIEEDPQIPPHEFLVFARFYQKDLTPTTGLDPNDLPEGVPCPENAYLVVDGTLFFQLTQSVVNIGRRPDNQLVINDSRVSRIHAQLRAINGFYIIFDLDTTGGTFVNGQKIKQCTLYPGDVISLAGVPLIFGQDEYELGETQQFSPNFDA